MVAADEPIAWRRLSAQDHERLLEVAGQVLSRHPWVKAAYLYGSAARGDRPARDIDVGLYGDPIPADCLAETALAAELASALPLSLPIDVRIINRADPVFLNNVLREGRLLYDADPGARQRFEARAIARWLDFRPVWERVRRDVLRSWAGE